ncbi:MAG TPA: GntR family transcriptional regulator [Burkholderiales bacterium]|nr:GntR family transcriptional regulator [Burkholderiales bacterium]
MEQHENRRLADAISVGGINPIPLYKEVKARLTRGLAAGDWKAGEAIPSEARLAERFSVSIGTIRKAIDELVAERILLRQQGRGTFVATHGEGRTLFYFFHIVGKDGSRELPVSELLSFRKARAGAVEEERLDVPRGAPLFRIQNLLRLGGKPVIFDDIAIPAELFADLDENIFGRREGTIYGLYQARYGITVTRISERISASRPSARAASVLEIADDAPALVIKRVAYTYDDTPVEYRVSWVDTERHEYFSDLWRTEGRS